MPEPFVSPNDRFPDFGINIHMLSPGEPSAKYHAESVQEDFLVLGARGSRWWARASPRHDPLPGEREKAARHSASAPEPTDDSRKAYADWSDRSESTKLPWPRA
jgi:hypothetical protein